MKRTILAVCVLISGIALWNSAQGEEECYTYPSAKETNVNVVTSVTKDNTGFRYEYKLKSSSQSIQDVYKFMVEISSDIQPESPDGWDGRKHRIFPVFSWSSAFPEKNIKPGNSLDGFVLKSKGIPTILTYYTRGWFEPEHFPEGSAPEPCLGQTILTNAVQGKTIGPTAPPADFKPIEFLDYIIGLKHEAVSLGWITNKGVENSLDVKLDSAKKKLEQDNATSAKNILNAFLKEVEAQGCKSYDKCPKGKHLTSEAYALLKYNVQYLIGQL